jgi:hypothetical protein
MTCEWRTAVTEYARSGLCEGKLEAHLARCAACAEWLESQWTLQIALQHLADGSSTPGPAVEHAVMAAFTSERRKTRLRRRAAIAAALIVAGLLTASAIERRKTASPPEPQQVTHFAPPKAVDPAPAAMVASNMVASNMVASNMVTSKKRVASPKRVVARVDRPQEPAPEPFVAIPYTLPLAAGERAWVVRMQLPEAALISTGFPLAGRVADTGPVEADVVVGEDGRARAIRVVSISERGVSSK